MWTDVLDLSSLAFPSTNLFNVFFHLGLFDALLFTQTFGHVFSPSRHLLQGLTKLSAPLFLMINPLMVWEVCVCFFGAFVVRYSRFAYRNYYYGN